MSAAGLVINDDGLAPVTIGGKMVEIDVYRVYNTLMSFDMQVREEYPDDKHLPQRQLAYLDKVCGLLDQLGFGTVTHFAADRFDEKLMKAADDLGKAPAPAPTPV